MTDEPRRKRQYVILPARTEAAVESVEAVPRAPTDPDQVARAVFHRSRHELIAEAAYYRSLERGPRGRDRDRDWLEAEREIDALLRRTPLF